MHDVPQQLRHLTALQRDRLLPVLCLKIRHGKHTVFPVNGKTPIRQLHIAVSIINLCMYFISIAAAFSAALKREQALQIWAAWPFPENFSFALYSPHILQ